MDMRDRGQRFRTSHPEEVRYMKELLNNPEYTRFKSTRDIITHLPIWDRQRVDYIPSNLGKGFIFYFVCNGCGQRVKYLYEYSTIKPPLCRVCCGLGYEAPPKKGRELIRLLQKGHYPEYPSEVRWMIAKRAGIRKEDLY